MLGTVVVKTSLPPNSHSSQNSLIPYCKSWAWQNLLLHQRLQHRRRLRCSSEEIHSDADVILLLEHDPVYTLGRGADENFVKLLVDDPLSRQRLSRMNRGPGSARLGLDSQILQQLLGNYEIHSQDPSSLNHHEQAGVVVDHFSNWAMATFQPVLAANGVPIYRVERGGECTYHGPGQLVVYPMFHLKQGEPFKDDLHCFVRDLEDVVIRTCATFGIDGACRDKINSGVWVNQKKVAAVGVAASRWITTHGFALNVNVDLDYFDTSVILPCGIEGRGVTSIATLLREQDKDAKIPTLPEVATVVLTHMQQVLKIELPSSPQEFHKI